MSLTQLVAKLIKLCQKKGWRFHIKIALSTIFVWFIWKFRARRHRTIPTRPGFLPIIGHTHYMMGLIPPPKGKEPLDNFKDMMLGMNEDAVYSTRFGNWSTVFLFNPKLIKFVFEDRFDDFEKSSMVRDRLFELLGDGIFASDGALWRKHRKIGSKMFSMRNLKNYMFKVAKTGNIRWMKKIEELRETSNEIDIYNLFGIYTLDVFVEIAFGQSLQIIEAIPKPHPFSVAFDNALDSITWRFRVPFFRIIKYFGIGYEAKLKENVKEIDKFAKGMIECIQSDKGKLTDETGRGKHNILSLFLQDNPDLTTKEQRDIAMNFIIAGRDTTRILLSWFFYELSLPDNNTIKQRIVDEIDTFYQHETELTYKNIQNHYGDNINESGNERCGSYFKYLEAALLETLRIHPPVPFLLRFACRDVKLPGSKGHIIEKGQGVVANSYMQGYNTKLWGDDAAEFKPERFLKKGLKQFEHWKFLAFNIAPRLCLGRHVAIMEAKLVTIRLLHKYRFEAVKDQKVIKQLTFILNMVHGFKIHLYPRHEP